MDLLRLDPSHAGPSAETLGRSFWDFPFPGAYWPDESERARCFPPLFRALVAVISRRGVVHATSPAFEGVAAWQPPGFHLTNRHLWQAAPLDMLRFYRNGGSKVTVGMEFQEAMRRRHAPMPHWFLGPIGVNPESQGQGFASKLMRPMLARADAQDVPVFLDTNSEFNISLYEHFGFRVMERADMPEAPIWNVGMLREPR
jgi:ribosomal protein S18 acetylase RimI-like enzyme